MPDEKKTPRAVDRKDYSWCDGCDGYVLKKLLKPRRAGFFNDEPGGLECPSGHAIAEEAPANG